MTSENAITLSGRVALVTGASQGIGRACALKLAEAGAAVAVAARSQEKLEQLVQQISAGGGNARAFPVDVAEEEQIKTAFKAAIAEFGKIDILVNNAGITRDQLVLRMKRADWDMVLRTNLTSAYLCTQQAMSSMLKQRWGRIINIASIFGSQKHDAMGHVIRRSHAAERNQFQRVLLEVIAQCRGHGGLNESRGDRIASDVSRSELARDGHGQSDQSSL